MKKIVDVGRLLILCIAVFGFGFFLISTSLASEEDNAPKITDFSITPTTFNTESEDQILTLGINLTGDTFDEDFLKKYINNLHIDIAYYNEIGFGKTLIFSNFKKNLNKNKSGNYVSTVIVPQGSMAGIWKVRDIIFSNVDGNKIHSKRVPSETGLTLKNTASSGVAGKFVSVNANNVNGKTTIAASHTYNILPDDAIISTVTDPVTSGNQTNVIVTGTAQPNMDINCWIDDLNWRYSDDSFATSNGSGAYTCGSLDVTELDEGTLRVYVSVSDAAGNKSNGSATRDITKDAFVGPRIRFNSDVDGPDDGYYIEIGVDGQTGSGDSHYGFSNDASCNASDTFPNAFTDDASFEINDATHNGKYICARYIDYGANGALGGGDDATVYVLSNAVLAYYEISDPIISTVTDPVNSGNQTNVMVTGTADPNMEIYCDFEDSNGDWTPAATVHVTSNGSGAYSCGPVDVTDLIDGTITAIVWAEDSYHNSSDEVHKDTTKNTLIPSSPIYRFWSDAKQGHFFTISAAEKDSIIATDPSWTYEGVAYNAFSNQRPNSTAIYRFWSNQKRHHFFTASAAEKNSIIANDPSWAYEGVAYYAYATEQSNTTAVYRFWSQAKQGHFFTISAAEKDSIIATDHSWNYEGIAWYVPTS